MDYELFNEIVGSATSAFRDPEDTALAVLLDCISREVDWLRLAVLLSSASLTPGEEEGLRLVLEHRVTMISDFAGLQLAGFEIPDHLRHLRDARGGSFRELLRVIGEATK